MHDYSKLCYLVQLEVSKAKLLEACKYLSCTGSASECLRTLACN
jgi:hypothetical protein